MASPSDIALISAEGMIIRITEGLFNLQPGSTYLRDFTNYVEHNNYDYALLADLLINYINPANNEALASRIVENLELDGEAATIANDYLLSQLNANSGQRGRVVSDSLYLFSQLVNDETFGSYASKFNEDVIASYNYSMNPLNTAINDTADGTHFNLEALTAAGADDAIINVMRLTGDQVVRIDFTNPANQVTGLDLNGDGIIQSNGQENTISGVAADFGIVDAYARNPLDHGDEINNYLGDIHFDGTGFDGDGVSTNGNIFLGGLGADTAFGGIGNDFLAGGEVAQGRVGNDYLSGGRNADFFFTSLSLLSPTDGDNLVIDGGTTSDDAAPDAQGSTQDADWLLFEASDDDEPVTIRLSDDNANPDNRQQSVETRSGVSVSMDDIENIDASGNLYGFLNNIDVTIGELAGQAHEVGTRNTAIGASAQLDITGSNDRNIIIGGYDNDMIRGLDGDDILFGGNLDYNNNPNLQNIINDGKDYLYGGSGDDDIIFEADGGELSGDSHVKGDTLWLTHLAFGTGDAASMTSDGVVRIDLASDDDSNGYGGADVDGTEDETNWTGEQRVTVIGFENVIASGLGSADYAAAGTNNPDLNFDNLVNRVDAIDSMLDIRGDDGDNVLYGAEQNDVIEGRDGNDSLSGRGGNDDFIFELGFNDGNANAADAQDGDGVDVIHRQDDDNQDGLWDGTFSRDFGLDNDATAESSSLVVTIDNNDTSLTVARVSFFLDGTQLSVASDDLLAAANMGEVVSVLNTELAALNPLLSVALGNNTQASALEGVFIVTALTEEGASEPPRFVESGTTFDPNSVKVFLDTSDSAAASTSEEIVGGVNITQDRLIYVSYEDRLDGERTDDDSVTGSNISLGRDSYAEDLVIHFADEDGDGLATTRIAEDQSYVLTFTNLTTEDVVTISVNGVNYQLQVGVDLDGNNIPGEDTNTGITQAAIQTAFLTRVAGFINSFMDDDTAAGSVNAATNDGFASTLVLTQNDYNGEETVFMVLPTVDIQNLSKGEAASVTVTNNSSHELEILDFDGRNNELNRDNVLFWGSEEINRSYLETAENSGSLITGSNAVLIDDGAQDLQTEILDKDGKETGDLVFRNTATNSAHDDDNFSVHGDDFLLGGNGADDIKGGTGDDRVQGSLGNDKADGGKNLYAVKVVGETDSRVYELNAWEAANFSIPGKVINAPILIHQSETGTALASGLFDDTLIFEQADFRNETNADVTFTITLNDYDMNGNAVELRNGGAGTVDVIETQLDGTTKESIGKTIFTNFENVRTASGTGRAVAGDGQGNDTLVVSGLSKDTGGISYNLTNGIDAGRVDYSQNAPVDKLALTAGQTESAKQNATVASVKAAILGYQNLTPINAREATLPTQAFKDAVNAITITNNTTVAEFLASVAAISILNRPTSALDTSALDTNDYESLVMRVDGVENVIAGEGSDLLIIDETEAAKNNTFSAGLGVDRIEYQNDFVAGNDMGAQPTITIKVNSSTDTDTVVSTAGRLGTVVATDTLESVEYITLAFETAQSTLENDVLDVTAMTTGAVVDFTKQEVRDLSGNVQVVIEGMGELESVLADGDDTVIVADNQSILNAREDVANGTAPEAIQLQTYMDFDDDMTGGNFTEQDVTARTEFTAKKAADLVQVVNQGQFSYSLSATGDGNDTDRVDYSAENGNIVSVVDFNDGNSDHYIVVDGNVDGDFTDASDRIDHLENVEEVVASTGNSVIDLTNFGQDINLKYQKIGAGTAASTNIAEPNTIAVNVFFEDQKTSIPFEGFSYVEYYDNQVDAKDALGEEAFWNQVEGSDANEYIELTSDQLNTNHIFNLRGGNNEVNYNEMQSIGTILTIDAVKDGVTTIIVGGIDQVEGEFEKVGDGVDTISSYNETADIQGTLRIEGSQTGDDTIDLNQLPAEVRSNTSVLGEKEGLDSVISITITTDEGDSKLVTTGYEFLKDSSLDDTYVIEDLTNFLDDLTLVDNENPAEDSDTLVLKDGALEVYKAIDWSDDSIELDALEDELKGFDFDTLDISNLTEQTDVVSTNDANETLILGSLSKIGDQSAPNDVVKDVQGFETIVFKSSDGMGNSVVIDMDKGEFREADGSVLFTFDSASTFDFTQISSDLTVSVESINAADVTVLGVAAKNTITGSAGDDVLKGQSGNDTLKGGTDMVLNTITVPLATEVAGAVGGGTVTVDGVTWYTTVANDGASTIATAMADYFEAHPTATVAGSVPKSVVANGNILTISFDKQIGNLAVNAAIADTDANVNVQNPAETTPFFAAGAGNDALRGGEGVDTMDGGAGNDQFVVVGSIDQAQADIYKQGVNIPAGISKLVSTTELTTVDSVSDSGTNGNGEVIKGGDGIDTLHVYGEVDLSSATVTGLNVIEINSGLTLSSTQLDNMPGLSIDLNNTGTFAVVAPDGTKTLYTDQDALNELLGTITKDPQILDLNANQVSVNEGQTAVFTVDTKDYDGMTISYTLSGQGITGDDFVTGSLTGSIIASGNQSTIAIGIAEDETTEGQETMVLTIDGTDFTAVTVINDTSVGGDFVIVELPIAQGDSVDVTANPVPELFTMDVVTAEAQAANTQINLSQFSIADDFLQFDIATPSAQINTLDQLNGYEGISVTPDEINNQTVVDFGFDGDNDVIILALVGITDASQVNIDLI